MTPKKLVIIVRPPPKWPLSGAQACPHTRPQNPGRRCPGCTLAVPRLHPGGALVSRDTDKPRRCRCGSLGGALAAPWLHPGCTLAAPWRCRCKTFRPALAVPWRCRCGAEDGGLRFRTTSGRGHPDRRPYLPDRFRVISGPPLLLFFIIKDLPGPSLIYKKNHHRNQQRT